MHCGAEHLGSDARYKVMVRLNEISVAVVPIYMVSAEEVF